MSHTWPPLPVPGAPRVPVDASRPACPVCGRDTFWQAVGGGGFWQCRGFFLDPEHRLGAVEAVEQAVAEAVEGFEVLEAVALAEAEAAAELEESLPLDPGPVGEVVSL